MDELVEHVGWVRDGDILPDRPGLITGASGQTRSGEVISVMVDTDGSVRVSEPAFLIVWYQRAPVLA